MHLAAILLTWILSRAYHGHRERSAPITGTISGKRDIVMPESTATKRLAHRVALVAAALWWGYAFFSTRYFTNLSGTGLIVHLIGLPVCYALVWFGVRGIAWILAGFRS